MFNKLSDDTNVTLLLCADLGGKGTLRPLIQTEYIQLASWLAVKDLRFAHLMEDAYLQDAAACGLAYGRLRQLMGRGIQLGFCVEEWQRSGVWIISRSDSAYPKRLRTVLEHSAPPLLFGSGHQALLHAGGFAILGPDSLSAPRELIARKSAALAACSDRTVITAGHYRVADASVAAAREAGGKVIRVLADKLIHKSVEKSARRAIAAKRLVHVSTCSPSARSAMLHAAEAGLVSIGLADQALYVSGTGIVVDTYGSATAMKQGGSGKSFFVWTGKSKDVSGDAQQLLDRGAELWSDEQVKLDWHPLAMPVQSTDTVPMAETPEKAGQLPPAVQEHTSTDLKPKAQNVYEAVLPILRTHCEKPRSVDELSELLDVQKGQLKKWLRQSVRDGVLSKDEKSTRGSEKYEINRQESLPM